MLVVLTTKAFVPNRFNAVRSAAPLAPNDNVLLLAAAPEVEVTFIVSKPLTIVAVKSALVVAPVVAVPLLRLIDKTSDVLDSAIDMKKINKLYLQSLLDPSKFEFAGDKWLHEIKLKLKDFQSTEGIIPQVKEEDIEFKKAAEIKHSPLPKWLENLITQYTFINDGSIKKDAFGVFNVKLQNQSKHITFDAEIHFH